MSLLRRAGQTLWTQIEAALEADIAAGRLSAGTQLPPEPALMQRFGVSRSTVRQAIASLERRNLVHAEQGRGTFVGAWRLHYPISTRTRFSRNLIEQGFDPGSEIISEQSIPAGAEIGARLQVPASQTVSYRRGIAKADGIPIELGEAFVPLDRFPGFFEAKARHATYTATFAAYGVRDYVRQSTLIEARMPTEQEAALLAQTVTAPVFVLTRVDADLAGRPILFGRAVWSAERVAFDVTEPVGPAPGDAGGGPD